MLAHCSRARTLGYAICAWCGYCRRPPRGRTCLGVRLARPRCVTRLRAPGQVRWRFLTVGGGACPGARLANESGTQTDAGSCTRCSENPHRAPGLRWCVPGGTLPEPQLHRCQVLGCTVRGTSPGMCREGPVPGHDGVRTAARKPASWRITRSPLDPRSDVGFPVTSIADPFVDTRLDGPRTRGYKSVL